MWIRFAIKCQLWKVWSLNESYQRNWFYFPSVIMYLASMLSLTRRGYVSCMVLDVGEDLTLNILYRRKRVVKTDRALVWSGTRCICQWRKNIRDHPLLGQESRFATTHILRKARAPMTLLLDPTTAHWAWRDGGSSVVPSWLHPGWAGFG